MDVNTRTRYDQYDLSVREKVQFFLCGYAAGFFLMMVFYKDLLIAAAGGLACIFFLPLYRGALCRRRRELLETQFRDFLYAVASSVAAGRQLRRALEDAELQLEAANTVIAKELSVRRTESLAAELLKEKKSVKKEKAPAVDYLGECARELEQALGRRVRMTQGRKGGRIELEFYDADDREALLDALKQLPKLARKYAK